MNRLGTFNLKWGKHDYKLGVYSVDERFDHSPGIYVFTKRDEATKKHIVLYIGQTNDFATRMASHEKMGCAERKWMNRICFLEEPTQNKRDEYEEDLIRKWKPLCNELLK